MVEQLSRAEQFAGRRGKVCLMFSMVSLFAGCLQLLGYFSLPAWWPIAAMGAGVCVAGLRFGWLQVRAAA